ncbi:YbhB/YbcL family Raf kinase inhibitor-like protein [Azohydromonas lata]|uniref:YbhB/YbcL family Raf kinase inhibitor-like protein n=1 Tax=Azohydromonas lata TaxID=45677 RepID=A0ABU5IFR5_9BURK|nr:hypothetical protein [Azohydromonas lata]MDZ5457964.1 hypothetical protein [Azohydromonas lata]
MSRSKGAAAEALRDGRRRASCSTKGCQALRYELVDLNPNDGITPYVRFTGQSYAESYPAHRYHFTVYALKLDKLELPPKATATATASLAGFMVNANALGKAKFTSTYQR